MQLRSLQSISHLPKEPTVHQDTAIATLQQLGFTQYEAQCYVGLLTRHPLNGSQLSAVSGVPRSMVYQTLSRLEDKAAVVRLSGPEGEPQEYEPVAPQQVIAHLSARFQATCDQVEQELGALAEPPAEVVVNVVGADQILERAAALVHQARTRICLMGGTPELSALEPMLAVAAGRGLATRIVSVGPAPIVQGQVATFLGDNVSAPTRFLLLVADNALMLIATLPPDTQATAVVSANPILARLFTAFLNTEYYLVRLSNKHPHLIRDLLDEVLEPEDRERYANILRFLDQTAAATGQVE
jgi:sugar-specific transcriptional regulator TrmB